MDLELFVDVSHVEGDRGHADFQFHRGCLVVVPINEHLEQPRFVRREMIIRAFRRANVAEKLNDLAGDFANLAHGHFGLAHG